MPLNEQALSVVTRSIPKEQIKQRPGKAGMTFNYISAAVVIQLLNEAFEHSWSTTILSSAIHTDTVVVGLELTICNDDGNYIHKQQFGSCDMGRGMGPGEAFKGAASDALKKAATLLGIGLELYQDDESATKAPPRLPQSVSRPNPPKPNQTNAPKPPAPAASVPSVPKASVPASLPVPPVSPVPSARAPAPPKPGNPFGSGTPPTTASVPAPPTPPATSLPAPPRANPFANTTAIGSAPNSTQINAMTNLATRKNLSQPEMIALANITCEQGSPVETFEELTHAQAIQVIKAAQL